nr:conserved phage C-terminal domain-containing protein [uncultured Anaerostipes sp.]
MAERRMFAIKIVKSARFLKMPASSQCLYFHLGLNADDDGIVEAYTVMRSVGATEDDLKILVAKGFVKVLNEDLVTYIIDWQEHNKIRADRKIDSLYKDLLLQIIPDAPLIEKRQRADVNKKKNGPQVDVQRTTNGPQMDRIGKDRLGKVRIEKDIVPGRPDDKPKVRKEIIDHLNVKAGKSFRYTTQSTVRHINARLNEGFKLDDFITVIDTKVAEWSRDKAMKKYIRPETLFGQKFESYLNQEGGKDRDTDGQNTADDLVTKGIDLGIGDDFDGF